MHGSSLRLAILQLFEFPQTLFDDYENTQIILTLPEGVSIVQDAAGSLQNVTEVIRQGNEWRLKLTEKLSAASSQSGTITIPLLIEGNGQRGMGETLDFTTPVRMETEFTILDRDHSGSGAAHQEVRQDDGGFRSRPENYRVRRSLGNSKGGRQRRPQ